MLVLLGRAADFKGKETVGREGGFLSGRRSGRGKTWDVGRAN